MKDETTDAIITTLVVIAILAFFAMVAWLSVDAV